jgi:hypothetical protein
MKIQFKGFEHNRGNFAVCDDLDNVIFCFQTQIKNKEQLQVTLTKYLIQVTKEQEEEKIQRDAIIDIINAVNVTCCS